MADRNKHMKHGLIVGAVIAGAFVMMNAVAKHRIEPKSINEDNPYIRNTNKPDKSNGYVDIIKPAFDKILSFMGLVVLSPLYAAIALFVVIDDPGTVFFTQKRVGINGTYFMLHKFRSMKMSAPHNIPTHKLRNPEQYITRVGKVLRKTSLDELPQIWDIFRGKMSIIGPRPALWNQEDLIAEREKYGANNALPGLTGLAQIKGRDELEIVDKARLDGEYVKILKAGGIKAFVQDVRCFIGTIESVVKHDGVVEGGTGSRLALSGDFQTKVTRGERFVLRSEVPLEDPEADWGYKKSFSINTSRSVSVLITGANSYIGKSFELYAQEHYSNIKTQTLDMKAPAWKECDFCQYDCIFHVAGIAHADVGKTSAEERENYYRVNTDLAIETAKKAKASKVKQFVLMSPMIIYGGAEKVDEDTIPKPANFYGDSKWQADKGVRGLASPDFHVAVLRPPMIYGKGSNGNYPTLSRIAKQLPVFPASDNIRSMLYIENLCEFLCQLMLSSEGGIYMPQNAEYSNTSKLVEQVGRTAEKKVHVTKLLSPAVWIGAKIPGKVSELVQKAFGSCYYDKKVSTYDGLDYQRYSLSKSIERTESVDASFSNIGGANKQAGAVQDSINRKVKKRSYSCES